MGERRVTLDPTIVAGGGSAGLIIVLLYVANKLWAAHESDVADVRAEKREALALNDKLADGFAAMAEGTRRVLERLDSLERELRERDTAAEHGYAGPERRHTGT